MEIINKTVVASVPIIDIRVSEDEVSVYEAALSHALATLSPDEMLGRVGATRDEIEGMRDDLRAAAARHDEAAREPVLASGF